MTNENELEAIKDAAEDRAIQTAIASLNRDSIKENGHPAVVCKRIDGEMHYLNYLYLSAEQITQFKNEGIIAE